MMRPTGADLRELAVREGRSPRRSARRYVALVTRAMLAGDRDALADFGVLQQEGYRDEHGRVLVRANPKGAARAFLRAASAGSASAAQSLGYCYDVGVGVRRNSRLAMKWYLRAWHHRYPTAAANIATVYRDRGLLVRAVRWWQRAVEAGLPEEAVEVGYSYQYGIGVRRNLGKAVEGYRSAIRARNILAFAQEAAMYHLAVLHVDGRPPNKAKAVRLLERASKDRDYPEAMRLLALLRKGRPLIFCRCRRGRVRAPLANARCEIHRGR